MACAPGQGASARVRSGTLDGAGHRAIERDPDDRAWAPLWNDRLGRWSHPQPAGAARRRGRRPRRLGARAGEARRHPRAHRAHHRRGRAPLVGWLRRRGLSPILAAWITLVGGILVLGGIITAIVFAVRNQWDELATSATEGFDDLQAWVQDLPFPIDEQQIRIARDSVVDYLTSAEFGADGAYAACHGHGVHRRHRARCSWCCSSSSRTATASGRSSCARSAASASSAGAESARRA